MIDRMNLPRSIDGISWLKWVAPSIDPSIFVVFWRYRIFQKQRVKDIEGYQEYEEHWRVSTHLSQLIPSIDLWRFIRYIILLCYFVSVGV